MRGLHPYHNNDDDDYYHADDHDDHDDHEDDKDVQDVRLVRVQVGGNLLHQIWQLLPSSSSS